MASSSEAVECPIPIVDFDGFREGDAAHKAKIAAAIGAAARDIGFMAVKNHGVDPAVIETMGKETWAFFDLPAEEKEKWASPSEAEYPYGYVGFGKETLRSGLEEEAASGKTSDLAASELADAPAPSAAGVPDLKECMSMGPHNPASGMPAPRLPSKPEGMAAAWLAYYKAMEELAGAMLEAFALALDLPADWFADKTDAHRCALRALNYPDLDVAPPPGAMRASPHTDYGTLTILLPDDAPGGLQVKGKDGSWLPVPYLPGHFVINLGDLMQRWTNDQWVSTLHRVVPPLAADVATRDSCRRQSVAFFHNVNADVVVEAIPTTVSESKPAKYPSITAFEHLMEKHLASVGHKVADEAKAAGDGQ